MRWNELFGPKTLFCCGAVMALLFLFIPSMPVCAAMFVFFCILAWLSGKKINVLVTISVMAGIVFFNLLAPYGKVLAELGPFRITQGSLLAGVRKALVLEGLVLLSGACVHRNLRLPGKIGRILADSFRLLEQMRERKSTIRPGHIIEGIDRLMLEMETNKEFTL
jgi:hypothetical protein